MKVLLLDLGKIMRGGQRQVYYLARQLAASPDYDPLVVVPGNSPLCPLLSEAQIPFVTLPSNSDLNPLNIFKFFRIVGTQQPTVVHTNDAKGASLAAMAKKFISNFKLVHSRRVSYPLKSGWSKNKYLAGDALVAVSQEIQEVLVKCGVPQEKTRTIHSGIDADLYKGLTNGGHPILTIGAVGALSTQKGFDVLVEALAFLKKEKDLPDWQCLIAGDGPLLHDLKQQADVLELTDKILFLGYRDSREVLPQIDILTVPSVDGEGSNAVIKEGWATGTPVITSDLPSNLELVEHEKNGLVFRNRSAKELASSIVRIAQNQDIANQLVAEGTKSLDDFTDTIMAQQYMTLYRELTD